MRRIFMAAEIRAGCSRRQSGNQARSSLNSISRRDFLCGATLAGAASLASGHVIAQTPPDSPLSQGTPILPQNVNTPSRGGLLYPQQNQARNVLDLSGLWQFQLDPREEGEAQAWFKTLPAPRPIAVPCSWKPSTAPAPCGPVLAPRSRTRNTRSSTNTSLTISKTR